MASGAVSVAIETFLRANWTATALVFENLEVDTNGNSMPPSTAAIFIEVEFTGTSYGQQSLGASIQADNRWDEEGLVMFNVMIPKGEGSGDGRTYAKQLADLFRGETLLNDNLEFLDATIGRGERSTINGAYFVIPVDIEWRRVEA